MFEFSNQLIDTRRGERRVLVATPAHPMIMGRDRLLRLRRSTQRGRNDLAMLRQIREQPEPVDVLIIRCQSEKGAWALDERLHDREAQEIVELTLARTTETWTELFERGVKLIVHVEAPTRDARLFREVLSAMARGSGGWTTIGKRVFFFSLSFDKALERVGQLLPSFL